MPVSSGGRLGGGGPPSSLVLDELLSKNPLPARVVPKFAGGVSGDLAHVYLYGIGDTDIPSFVLDLFEDRRVLDNRVVGCLEFVV